MQENQTVLVKTDNITTKQYFLNHDGTGSPALCALTLKLLMWCQERGITLTAEYIPGFHNTLADRLSRRTLSQTEWSQKQSVVHQLFLRFKEPQIDLFASAQNVKLSVYCSWRFDPKAHSVDALSICWSCVIVYAFPPIALLHRVLLKVQQDQVLYMILIAPRWPGRPWYPLLLDSLIEHSVWLPLTPNLLTQEQGRVRHANLEYLCLVAWPVSGVPWLRRDYQNKFRALSSQPGPFRCISLMSQAGSITLDGVGEEVSTPLFPLGKSFFVACNSVCEP